MEQHCGMASRAQHSGFSELGPSVLEVLGARLLQELQDTSDMSLRAQGFIRSLWQGLGMQVNNTSSQETAASSRI